MDVDVRHFHLMRILVILFILFWYRTFTFQPAQAGSPGDSLHGFFVVKDITITGNKVTRSFIITRELPFQSGDTVSSGLLSEMMVKARQNIFNTNLFNVVTVTIDTVSPSPGINFRIDVIERWYFWPVPYAEPADRNINVWLKSWDFSRVTYGVDFTFENVRGRRERLTIPVYFGYNYMVGFDYLFPYVNKRQTIGLGFGGNYSLAHEIAVNTVNDKPLYRTKEDGFLQRQFNLSARMLFRRGIYNSQLIRLDYVGYRFSDEVERVPGFLLEPANELNFFNISWNFRFDHRDVHFYPLKGYYFDLMLNHSIPYGNTHNSFLKTKINLYDSPVKRFYLAGGLSAKVSFSREQPYLLQKGLGYDPDVLRGYEYYVIDGQHFVVLRTEARYAIVPWHIDRLRIFRSEKFNTFPWALYANVFGDLGYVKQYPESAPEWSRETNRLVNRLLASIGTGIDFTTYYDVVVRLEFTVNSFGTPGFYIHFKAPI